MGLSAAGAVVGAALGGLSLGALLLLHGVWGDIGDVSVPLIAGGVFGGLLGGGLLGSVLAPVAAWTLMRHVPLWRAIGETALGTVIGVAVGDLLGPWLGRPAPWEMVFALLGFTAAAIRLRLTHRGAASSVSGGPEAL